MKANILLGQCLIICIFSITACGPKTEKADVVAMETPASDSLDIKIAADTSKVEPPRPVVEEPKTPEGYDPDKPKICNPSFKLLKSPGANQHVYYVSGFNPGEFKCWEFIETHGQEVCGKKPCQVYYVDAPDVSISSAAPYIDKNILAKKGVAFFTHDNNYFEIKGAKTWGRTEKGYLYYNTNNHLGG